MKKFSTLVVVVGILVISLGLVSVAWAQDPTTVVNVTEKEFKIGMSTTTVPANTPVKFVITNNGVIPHELIIEPAGADDKSLQIPCGGGDCKADAAEVENILPGMTKTAVWTILAPGEYQLACHVAGHYEAGMVEKFTVVAAPASSNVVAASKPAAAPAPSSPAPAPQQLPATGGETPVSIAWGLVAIGVLMVVGGLVWRYQLIWRYLMSRRR